MSPSKPKTSTKISQEESEEPEEHGVAQGVYDNLGHQVILFCLCGHPNTGGNWEEAGAELDAHLEENAEEDDGDEDG